MNPKSPVVRTLKVLGVLFKIAFCLFFTIAKLWAAMDDGQKEKDSMQKAEEELEEARRDSTIYYHYYNRD